MLLQADIMDVNQIFKDLAVMIHDQGDIIGVYTYQSCVPCFPLVFKVF